MKNMTKTPEKQDNPSFHLILVAGGTGQRYGGNLPKQFLKINGKSVLEHTLDKFLSFEGIKSIVIAMDNDYLMHLSDPIKNDPKIKFCKNGKSRKESVYNALKFFSNVEPKDKILIHDAVRPLISDLDIYNILQSLDDNKGATLCTPVTETLFKDKENIDRNEIYSIQTPQGFYYQTIMDAHENFKSQDNFTDDAALVRANGGDVDLVMATAPNIKITTSSDFEMVKAFMNKIFETRVASGFDVHAFEKEITDRPLMLGGIVVEHDYALVGHSDADVVLHAITDAILGSINEGDIGTHFPPSDNQWKDRDSAYFLNHAHNLLCNMAGEIRFVDVTVMAEQPKIGRYRELMQNNIAKILQISPNKISIKATTTEKLGFVGRKEGIACQAIATIRLPMEETI